MTRAHHFYIALAVCALVCALQIIANVAGWIDVGAVG